MTKAKGLPFTWDILYLPVLGKRKKCYRITGKNGKRTWVHIASYCEVALIKEVERLRGLLKECSSHYNTAVHICLALRDKCIEYRDAYKPVKGKSMRRVGGTPVKLTKAIGHYVGSSIERKPSEYLKSKGKGGQY
jgi:hypothetical protein